MKYIPRWGLDISEAADAMVALAIESGEDVEADFNGIRLTATPTSFASDIVVAYRTESDERRRKYQASPEGIASAARQKEAEEKARLAAAQGLMPFEVINHEGWFNSVKINDDPYGACAVRYAARWANLMEAKMAMGSTLVDCANATSREADVEGITGFMYGCVVSLLSRVWKHGEALRKWHNLKTQLGTEGEKANESGGVLNPALLNIKP